MEKVKVINKNTGVIKEVNKSLASDYLGTGNFEIFIEKKVVKVDTPTSDKKESAKYVRSRY